MHLRWLFNTLLSRSVTMFMIYGKSVEMLVEFLWKFYSKYGYFCEEIWKTKISKWKHWVDRRRWTRVDPSDTDIESSQKGICINILIPFFYALNYKPSKILYSKNKLYIPTYFIKCFWTYFKKYFVFTYVLLQYMTICWIYGEIRLVWVWTCSKIRPVLGGV